MAQIKLNATYGLTGTLPAVSGANLTNLDARDLENALPAISGASLTGISGGIVHAEMFRLNSTATGEHDPLTDWTTTNGTASQGRIGSGMSVSSGVFTFPATGIWRIEFNAYFYRGVADSQCRILIKNNSGTEITKSIQSVSDANYYAHQYTSCMLDVTDVATDANKIKFEWEDVGATDGGTSAKLQGTASFTATHVVFTRLGDT